MKKIWMIGLLVGFLSGIAGIALFYLLTTVTGLRFEQLNPVSIMVASLIVNCAGAYLFAKLWRFTSRPRVFYTVIAISVALLLSWMDWAYPSEPGVGDVANPIHAIVVSISIILNPRWLRKVSQ